MALRRRSSLFRLFTTLTKRNAVYRALVVPAQRIEVAVERLGLRRRRSPAPLLKRAVLADYARRLGVRNFVETGTYLGDTAYELAKVVERVYTVELDPDLHARARERFASVPNVTVLHGDSGEVLAELVPNLDGATLYWLDAHYSGGATARADEPSAARKELGVILDNWTAGSAILIDDADRFVGRDGYLSLKTIRKAVAATGAGLGVNVKRNIVRVAPPLHAAAGGPAPSGPGSAARASR